MRPTIIPEQLIPEGYHRIVISEPGGDLASPDIAPVEAVVRSLPGATLFSMRLMLQDGDLERFARGDHVWLSIMANQLPPFAVRLGP